ncbi:MAG: hypothetical protein JO296_11995 [Pseudonocardiales bacterium]|nr:hypothetical protein [Pseudonocardiales bacterium]
MTHAKEYFDSALFIDPVEVSGSGMATSAADGDIDDWTVPWDKWTAMSALQCPHIPARAFAGPNRAVMVSCAGAVGAIRPPF